MSTSKIIYDKNILDIMNTFEKITHSRIKDCIVEEDRLIFVVLPGQLGKALGKKAENIKKLFSLLKKKIKIVEYNEDKLKFIQNFIHPLKIDNIHEEDNIVVLESADMGVKGLLIGRAAQNLRRLEEYIRRYFDIKEIKVV